MSEFKKHLNENVFDQNPFNDQVKQKMIKNVLNSNGLSKSKKRGPLIALISATCLVLFFAVTALEAPGLFNLGTSGSQLQQLQKEHPEMKKELDKLSPEFRKNIKLPTYFPFKISKKSVDVTSQDKGKELHLPEQATFFFGNDGKQFIQVEMMYFPQDDEGGIHSNPNPVELADGTAANLIMNKNAHIIDWFDKKAHIQYSIMIMVTNGHNPYEKDVLIKMANSMH